MADSPVDIQPGQRWVLKTDDGDVIGLLIDRLLAGAPTGTWVVGTSTTGALTTITEAELHADYRLV